jgi:hypothetical protein
MKTTKYFEFRRTFPDRIEIQDEWIQRIIKEPVKTVTQDDARIKKWGRISEASDRWLRVVLLEDGETVHNAFFDRDFKE